MLFFERKRKTNSPIIYTEETCQNCNHKIKRIFQDGDYIYKSGSTCEACPGIAMTTAIYGEYPAEKGKRSER
jgi:hypothetical protein